jgi:flagellar biosynthetic protein FliR
LITFTGEQLNAWITLLFFPLSRVLAFFAVAPIFTNIGLPVRIRLLTGIAVTLGILPLIPTPPAIDINSGAGLWVIAREMSIGIAMGFAMRIVFAVLIMAGEQIGFQMGLGFAVFYDPQSSSQSPVIAQFLSLITTLMFLAINGHLMLISTMAQSFQAIPIGLQMLPADSWMALVLFGSKIFSAGLLFALPVTIAMLVTNLALGVLTKAAPQLNLFAIGFPITLTAGFVIISLSLSYFAPPMLNLFEEGMQMMLGFARPSR